MDSKLISINDIDAFIFDFDGVMTNNSVYLDEDGNIRPEILAKHRDTRLVDKSDND